MKTFTQHLLTFSFFFLTLTFSLQTFAQHNAPVIVDAAKNGGGNGTPCIISRGDVTLEYLVYIDSGDMGFLKECNFHVGYELLLSGYTYQAMPAGGFTQINIGIDYVERPYVQNFEIFLTQAEYDEMCAQEQYVIHFDMFCLVDGVFESITNGVGIDISPSLCCEPIHDFGDEVLTRNVKEGSEFIDLTNTNQFLDYYIYDLHGNQIDILQNQSTNLTVQEHISNLSIQTGIYLIRFWNGKEMETNKVFKL